MKYKAAPIREAILDIRTDALEKDTIKELEQLHEHIKDDYPNKKKQINFTGKFELKEGEKVKNESDSRLKGFLFSTEDGASMVQMQLDGFSFNKLKPYNDWDNFSAEALRLWDIYHKVIKPKGVKRIALRYINRIELPLPVDNFQEYIVNMPPIPPNLPKTFKGFFMQIQVPCDVEGTNLILTETLEQPSAGKLPFILDIDAYKAEEGIEPTRKSLQKEFGVLRHLKNDTFESCITDKTRALFN